MTDKVQPHRSPPHRRKGLWEWLFASTIGNCFKFLKWSFYAILISVLSEWAGMIWFWEPDHSQKMLSEEISFLSNYNKNVLTGLYPHQLGTSFLYYANEIVSFLHLRDISAYMESSASRALQIAYYGMEAVVNTIFIFAVRSAICVSAMTGFALVGLVAFIDGLVERDIRKACGGIESAMVYHRSKRMIVPLLFISFGGYLTAPATIHPTIIFLPVMAVFAIAIFTTAKSFKKFL